MSTLVFYGKMPPLQYEHLRIGGLCPYCKKGTKFSLITNPMISAITENGIKAFVLSYACELCSEAIPIRWKIVEFVNNSIKVHDPVIVLPNREVFEFEYVPDAVKKEIEEALACLAVGAFNGFAALCRRVIQSICTDLGAGASTKIQKQIEEMFELTGLEKEWQELVLQIMLSGHDGAHPHLPDVNADRASILLSLLKDLAYQLYTRPGRIKQASLLRNQTIERKRTLAGILGENNE